MVANHFADAVHGGERLEDFRAQLGVGLHGGPFGGVERAGLIQNGFGDADFADVVQQTRETDFLDFGLIHAQRLRDHHGIRGNFLRVALGVAVFRVNGQRERSDSVHDRGRNGIAGVAIAVLDERARELLEAAVNFVEGVGAGGELALERDAEIGFEDIFFPALGVVGIALLRAGNGVSALMFREVHRGVRDLNQFLRRGTVHRETGDAEAGGDIFVAQQRIGGDPAAQLAGELDGLLDAGFRHEDDEFVAAVTRDDIGAAAILFENVADALQDDVAFQVAVEIVDEFEAVEVHQDQREGAIGARGALPFGGERFHEEAVRFDAGEAVGDGLFLSFLERDGVVQRAGE